MDDSLLSDIGLSFAERKVYLSLFELGPSTIGTIVQRTALQKSSAYFCLEKLISRGIVSYFVRNNSRVFDIESPLRIIDFLEKKKSALELQERKIRSTVVEFERKRKELRGSHCAKVFEGWDGLHVAFEDILESMGKGETYNVLGVTTVPGSKERFRRFIRQFHLKRASKGIVARIILSEDLIDSVGFDREQEPLTQVRYISRAYFTPAISNIYKDKVLFTVWDPPYAFQLESRELAASLRNYFSSMWKTSKTRKQLGGKKVARIRL
ncbi:MAG: hypothetical protein NUV67_06125 [archaeon]|nr:hypothetical protein [archaeon]